MKLYSYWRSTTSYRIKAALNLKGVAYETVSVDLAAGEQNTAGYLALNPSAAVPALELDDGTILTQSMAILEYIDSKWPEPRLIPEDPLEKARVNAIAHSVAMDIHPVNNLCVIAQLKACFDASPDQCREWMAHWMLKGFAAVETMVSDSTKFSTGADPNIADLCIVAQVFNARRWDVNMATFPNILRIEQNCLALPAIAAAQPDAKENI